LASLSSNYQKLKKTVLQDDFFLCQSRFCAACNH
jgi:hypothetical protein